MRHVTWTQLATLIVSIVAAAVGGAGVIVLSVNGIHSQVAALQAQAAADRAEAAADRRAWQASLDAYREKADADREAFRAQAEADREAFRGEVHRLGERQARVEGALTTAEASRP